MEWEQFVFLGDISGEARPKPICDTDSVFQVPQSCWEAGTDLRAQTAWSYVCQGLSSEGLAISKCPQSCTNQARLITSIWIRIVSIYTTLQPSISCDGWGGEKGWGWGRQEAASLFQPGAREFLGLRMDRKNAEFCSAFEASLGYIVSPDQSRLYSEPQSRLYTVSPCIKNPTNQQMKQTNKHTSHPHTSV